MKCSVRNRKAEANSVGLFHPTLLKVKLSSPKPGLWADSQRKETSWSTPYYVKNHNSSKCLCVSNRDSAFINDLPIVGSGTQSISCHWNRARPCCDPASHPSLHSGCAVGRDSRRRSGSDPGRAWENDQCHGKIDQPDIGELFFPLGALALAIPAHDQRRLLSPDLL